jgi:hypothetical protein
LFCFVFSECHEVPIYIHYGGVVVVVVIVLCLIVGFTGQMWFSSRSNATLFIDICTLIFYTTCGSIYSVFITVGVNHVLTEITVNVIWMKMTGIFTAAIAGLLIVQIVTFYR